MPDDENGAQHGAVENNIPVAMRKVYRRLQRWRNRRKGSERIPESLWAPGIAQSVCRELSESGAAKPLRPRLLSVEDAGVYLGRTKEAVQYMIANGNLPVVRDGRRVFLDIEELHRWIETNSIPARTNAS